MNASFRSVWICAALAVMPLCAVAQRYVISARPGAVNYVEGSAFVNGQPVTQKQIGKSFLQPNDVVSTDIGKAEVLLTPGTFLRIGGNSAARMISLSLTDIQVRVLRGEAMLEADELTKSSRLRVLAGAGDGSVLIQSPGLYRFTADGQPTVAVIQGKAEVFYAGRNARLHKHHEVVLAQAIQKRKFDAKKQDDLYAWSNARSEYNSAASYQTAQSVWQNAGDYAAWDGFLGGFGFAGGYGLGGPGWAWNPMFSSWAWLPGANMAFFSPFGYGFFAPAAVAYAPVSYAYTNGQRWVGPWRGGHRAWAAIAVNPAHPPAAGALPRSVSQDRAARAAAMRTFAGGFHTASGNYIPAGSRMVRQSSGPRFRPPMGANPAWSRNGSRAGGWSRPAARAGGNFGSARGRSAGGGFGGARSSGRMSGGAPSMGGARGMGGGAHAAAGGGARK
ncbi:MAG: hypothetical protein ACRD4O_03295 [Bryobacteraceae bacterium]